MAYTIEKRLAAKSGWFTPQQARDYYKRYSREGVTFHWWGGGESANRHDDIVEYFMDQAKAKKKSVNYVVSDKKITCMVEPDNVAWCSQSGNPTTISVECQPTLGEEGYKRVGWLLSDLEQKYRRTLSLYPHNHWIETDCPGLISLTKVRLFSKGETMSKADEASEIRHNLIINVAKGLGLAVDTKEDDIVLVQRINDSVKTLKDMTQIYGSHFDNLRKLLSLDPKTSDLQIVATIADRLRQTNGTPDKAFLDDLQVLINKYK